MLLTAILMVVVYSGLHNGIRLERLIAATVEDTDSKRATVNFFRKQFRHITTVEADEGYQFQGNIHRLQFTVPGFQKSPRLHHLQLAALPSSRPRRLMASMKIATNPEATGQTPITNSILIDDLEDFKFEYFGITENQTNPVWLDQWDSKNYPPQLVRLRYKQSGQDFTTLHFAVGGADSSQTSAYPLPYSE